MVCVSAQNVDGDEYERRSEHELHDERGDKDPD